MDENNYTPNMFARSLGLNTMKMVGVLCSDISDIFYARSISVIEKRLRAEGFDMILCCTGVNITDKKKYMELLLQKRVDAMILIGSIFKEQNDNSHIEEAARRVPLVIINSYLDLPNTYCVYCDEENAAYEAVSLMIKDGRKRIGYVCGPQTPNALLKEAGFRRALADNNLPAIPELIVHGRSTLEDAYAYVN